MPARCSASRTRPRSPAAGSMRACSIRAAPHAFRRGDALASSATTARAFPTRSNMLSTLGAGAPKLWVEDTGRWFAGPDGQPARAHGVVRVINERHEQRGAPRLSVAVRRAHRRDEPLASDRGARQPRSTMRSASHPRAASCWSRSTISARINEAYGFDIADEVIAEVAKRIRARHARRRLARPLLRQQVRRGAEELHARGHGGRGRPPARRGARRGGADQRRAGRGHRHDRRRRRRRATPARSTRSSRARRSALDAAKAKRRGSFFAYRPNIEREALRRENVRATDEIVTALNERRILLAFEPVVAHRARASLPSTNA